MGDSKIILGIETATLGGSVFLGRAETELASRIGKPDVSHSNSLLSDISASLDEAGLSLEDVDLFACASGPGSFTGLRIGIATLKALAATLERPCVGVPTLQAVASSAGPSNATVALLPAGRGELFAQMFSVGEDSDVVELDSAAHLSPERVVEKYSEHKKLIWAGNGAHAQSDLLKRYAEQHATDWVIAEQSTNLARQVAALALRAFEDGRVESPHSLSAIYVRPSDPELKLAADERG